MAFPQDIHEDPTGPTQLVPSNRSSDSNDISGADLQPQPLPTISPLGFNADTAENWPLNYPDDRVIVWELKRRYVGDDTAYEFHRKNRLVVPYNKALTALTGSNSAVYFLGSEEQAKGATYYLMEYMTKDATEMKNILSLVHEANIQSTKYKSQAEDHGTDERNATKFLSCINNKLSAKSEMSAIMAAAGILGMKSYICSHQFTYLYIRPAIDFVQVQLQSIGTSINLNSLFNNSTRDDGEAHTAHRTGEDDEEWDDNDQYIPPNNTAGQLFKLNDT